MDCSLNEDDEACVFAMQLGTSYLLPMAVRTAIELGLLELIKEADPAVVFPADLAARLPTTNPEAPAMLDRILHLLSCHSILKCSIVEQPDGRLHRAYAMAPLCKFLTKNDDGVSMAPLLLMQLNKAHVNCWYSMKDAILDGGIAFNKAYGMPLFEYHGTIPGFAKSFGQAMSDSSAIIMRKLLETYNGFEGMETIVDVGGGNGTTLDMIVSKYPSIRGINFDLPHVITNAPFFQGVEHVSGDMFVSVPRGSAIFMKITEK